MLNPPWTPSLTCILLLHLLPAFSWIQDAFKLRNCKFYGIGNRPILTLSWAHLDSILAHLDHVGPVLGAYGFILGAHRRPICTQDGFQDGSSWTYLGPKMSSRCTQDDSKMGCDKFPENCHFLILRASWVQDKSLKMPSTKMATAILLKMIHLETILGASWNLAEGFLGPSWSLSWTI